ncbi:MAG: hypothetical protein NTV54_13640 [Ignavibacteriales bacterium]|nr:hypothetical protein [Ignavibacteriales bacterium]
MGKDATTNVEELISQQVEMQKSVRVKRTEMREAEKKNRELKAQIGTALNLPKGVSVVIRKA